MKKGKLLSILMMGAILLAAAPTLAKVDDSARYTVQSQQFVEPEWLFETNRSPYYSMGDYRSMVVSSGCDVNGDGYDDLLIGRQDYDYIDPQGVYYRNLGIAWLFLGSATGLNNVPYRTFLPPRIDQGILFGHHVACAGDVNGDGYEDILITMLSYTSSPSLSAEGAVFVYYGSPTGPHETYDWMARGNSVWGLMGSSAESAGDINGDGYDDIIVGTLENDHQAIGHAYVWYGGADGLGPSGLPSNADWVASGPAPGVVRGNYFGYLVYGIGDVNGDSYDDVMVTAFLYDGAFENQGAVFVWYGSNSGLGEPGTPENADWSAVGAQAGAEFGGSGDGVGDLNGDGYDDLAVGAIHYDGAQWEGGAVFVWYGSASGLGANGTPANADWSAEGYSGFWFGSWTRPAGDVNLDGFADLLVTAPRFTVPSPGGAMANAGAWFIWEGSLNGLIGHGTPTNADVVGYGDQAAAQLGCCEAGAADVNHDGLDEIFVPAFVYDHPEVDEGVVFGYHIPLELFLPLVKR